MSKLIASAVVFDVFNRATSRFDEVTVPLGEALAFHDANRAARITKVVWQDGSWSWGKAWFYVADGALARIGAGAYGDEVIWRHPDHATRHLLAA